MHLYEELKKTPMKQRCTEDKMTGNRKVIKNKKKRNIIMVKIKNLKRNGIHRPENVTSV